MSEIAEAPGEGSKTSPIAVVNRIAGRYCDDLMEWASPIAGKDELNPKPGMAHQMVV